MYLYQYVYLPLLNLLRNVPIIFKFSPDELFCAITICFKHITSFFSLVCLIFLAVFKQMDTDDFTLGTRMRFHQTRSFYD